MYLGKGNHATKQQIISNIKLNTECGCDIVELCNNASPTSIGINELIENHFKKDKHELFQDIPNFIE